MTEKQEANPRESTSVRDSAAAPLSQATRTDGAIENGDNGELLCNDNQNDNTITMRLPFSSLLLCWLLLVVLHTTIGLLLVRVAQFYQFLCNPDINYYVRLIDTAPDLRFFNSVSCVYLFIALIHVTELLRMLWYSAQHRCIVMVPFSYKAQGKVSRVPDAQRKKHTPTRKASRVRYFADILRSGFNLIFAETGLLGIKSQRFNHVQALRKLLQIMSQSYQAAQISRLVTRQEINAIFLSAIIFNCLSTPLIFKFLHRRESLLRMLCLTCDILSGLCTAVILPYHIASTYLDAWDSDIVGFDDVLLYDDVWFVNCAMEGRWLVVTNWIDVAFRIYPFLECLVCLDGIKSLTHMASTPQGSGCENHPSKVRPSQAQFGLQLRLASVGPHAARRRNVRRIINGIFIGCAVIVGVFHGVAQRNMKPITGCKAVVRPWFTTSYSCAVLEINCYRQGFSGDATNIASVLSNIHAPTLMSLILSHCPALEIPPEIRSLPSLLGFEIYNSTLISWTSDAAFESDTHTMLTFITIVLTTFPESRLPEGLISRTVDSLLDVEMSYTDLSSLPDGLDLIWPSLSTLTMEHARFTSIPKGIKKCTQLTGIAFTDNQLTSIPSDLLVDMVTLEVVSLAWNAITELPPTFGASNEFLLYVALGHTELWSLPDHLLQYGSYELVVDDTPLCRDVHQHPENYPVEAVALLGDCEEESESTAADDSYYPIALVMPNRTP